jgi:hypothetical protein
MVKPRVWPSEWTGESNPGFNEIGRREQRGGIKTTAGDPRITIDMVGMVEYWNADRNPKMTVS